MKSSAPAARYVPLFAAAGFPCFLAMLVVHAQHGAFIGLTTEFWSGAFGGVGIVLAVAAIVVTARAIGSARSA